MLLRALLSVLLFVLTCGCQRPTADQPAESRPADAPAHPVTESAVVPDAEQPVADGVQYIPRISEERLQDFLAQLDPAARDEVTDEQVYAIMGPPTRRNAPVSGQRNGEPFTIYEAHWEKPGSGVKSTIAFRNGRLGGGGMTLGLEVPTR